MHTVIAILYPQALATSITLPMEILQAASQMASVHAHANGRGASTIDFLLAARRDAAAARRFFQKALHALGHPRPRVINVDGNPSYPKVIAELKRERKLGRRCRCRTCPYPSRRR